jgi:hypothetical protein
MPESGGETGIVLKKINTTSSVPRYAKIFLAFDRSVVLTIDRKGLRGPKSMVAPWQCLAPKPAW